MSYFETVKTALIKPDWPAPLNIHAATTTRISGESRAPFNNFNIADHVGDDPKQVAANRKYLQQILQLPSPPRWLKQVHGNRVVNAENIKGEFEADGSVSTEADVVCAVLTADCLPVLLCDADGTRVGVLHAGWRGLAAGIIDKGIKSMDTDPREILAWMGPAIGPEHFKVGEDVFNVFVNLDTRARKAFKLIGAGRWQADIYELARLWLNANGVDQVFGGGDCTYSDDSRFYSYRRDGKTGRMATLIWRGPAIPD